MFIPFFLELKAAKVPVSLREYLSLLEGLEAGLVDYDVEGFYYLARSALVKDERHIDRFDQVFAHVFKGVEAFATGDTDLINHLLGQLAATVPYGERGGISNVNFVAAALHSIVARDGLEVLLSIQMIGVHNLAMEFLKRAAFKEQTEFGLDANVNRATRFLQTFAKQMEVLKAYRSKGEQKVEVEHVHVHRGGQAIVGAVTHGGTGGKENGTK